MGDSLKRQRKGRDWILAAVLGSGDAPGLDMPSDPALMAGSSLSAARWREGSCDRGIQT